MNDLKLNGGSNLIEEEQLIYRIITSKDDKVMEEMLLLTNKVNQAVENGEISQKTQQNLLKLIKNGFNHPQIENLTRKIYLLIKENNAISA